MSTPLPPRLLSYLDGEFTLIDPRPTRVPFFDIVSYTWGKKLDESEWWHCDIPGVTWQLKLPKHKIESIKWLMITSGAQYLWCDCVCIDQGDESAKASEVSKMFDYYKYARQCHILLEMSETWIPQEVVDDLKFVDHVVSHMGGAAMASEARLTQNMINRLAWWADQAP